MQERGVLANKDRPAYAVSKVSDSSKLYPKSASNGRVLYMQEQEPWK